MANFSCCVVFHLVLFDKFESLLGWLQLWMLFVCCCWCCCCWVDIHNYLFHFCCPFDFFFIQLYIQNSVYVSCVCVSVSVCVCVRVYECSSIISINLYIFCYKNYRKINIIYAQFTSSLFRLFIYCFDGAKSVVQFVFVYLLKYMYCLCMYLLLIVVHCVYFILLVHSIIFGTLWVFAHFLYFLSSFFTREN